MKRYAIVRGLRADPETVARYLPRGYRVIWSGKTDWHQTRPGGGQGGWKQYPNLIDACVVIGGEDDHGWTLDKYVIPRLGSGMLRADEIDLSHPIMKEIPAWPEERKCPSCGQVNAEVEGGQYFCTCGEIYTKQFPPPEEVQR